MPTGEWFLYFAIQGPLLSAEAVARKRFKWVKTTPPWVAVPTAIGFQFALGQALFFPPCVRSGLDTRVVTSIEWAFSCVQGVSC